MVVKNTKNVGGQRITTHYKPTSSAYVKSEDEIMDEHADQRGQRRIARREQSTFTGKAKAAFNTMKGKFMERAVEVAHEQRETPAQERREHRSGGGYRRESYDPPMMMGMGQPPRDPFGVASFGGFGMRPEREPPEHRPRRKRKKAREAPRREAPRSQPRTFDPMYVPKSMRHMF